MHITFLTRKSALIYRRGLRQRLASLTLDCNGVFAIRAYWLRLFHDITSEKSRILFVQPAMLKNRTILSLDQRIEVLCHLGEAHHVERLLPNQCGKTQMARMLSKQTRKATVAYVEYKHSRTVGLQYLSCCYITFRLTTVACTIMTMRVFIRNIAGGDSSR